MHFGGFLGYGKIPDIFQKNWDFPKVYEHCQTSQKNQNLWISGTPATRLERFRENLEKLDVWSKITFFWIFGVLRQNSGMFQKSVKILKNHTKIQIHEFLIPQLPVLRDSENIWKNLISGPKLYFSAFFEILHAKFLRFSKKKLRFSTKLWKSWKIIKEYKSMNF